MSTVAVTFELPFYLRLDSPFSIDYELVCRENRLPELMGSTIRISISPRAAADIDRSDWPKVRSTVVVSADTPTPLPYEAVSHFAIQNCLDILNSLITSYQATTGEVSNAGFIVPLGTADMQLFAEIRVDGRDVRDRWPSHNINTMPLSQSEVDEITGYLSAQHSLPLSRVFLVDATLSLERGQYPVAVLLAAGAVDLRITQVVRVQLRAAGWSDSKIGSFEGLTLGKKLWKPMGDPQSVETYFHAVGGFPSVLSRAVADLVPLRNLVAHHGHLATHEEAKGAVAIARDFLRLVS